MIYAHPILRSACIKYAIAQFNLDNVTTTKIGIAESGHPNPGTKLEVCAFIGQWYVETLLVDMQLAQILIRLLISILFYPITLEGRRGTTDEFATPLSILSCFQLPYLSWQSPFLSTL